MYNVCRIWPDLLCGMEFTMKKRINITLEDEVIQRIDHYADQHYTSRSGAITMLIVEATEDPRKKKTTNKAGE